MAKAQLERWAIEHPTAPRAGRFFEVPFSYIVPRVGAGIAVAGALWWLNGALFWNYKPETLSPEFREEAQKIGNVAVSSGAQIFRHGRHSPCDGPAAGSVAPSCAMRRAGKGGSGLRGTARARGDAESGQRISGRTAPPPSPLTPIATLPRAPRSNA
jgi:hypothetical protein